MAVTEQIYTKDDFKQAVSALLPAGQYWQYEQGDQLDAVLEALAAEFKTIHDETKIDPLYQQDNNVLGWKLADYQAILNDNEIVGTVFDDSSTPNLIYINFEAGQVAGDFMKTLESYRLPHTAFCCTYAQQKTLSIAVCRQTLQINRRELRAV
jgi:hypothetical protein